MAGKISELTNMNGATTVDRTTDFIEIVDTSAGTSYKATPNFVLGFTGGSPVSTSDTQTLTNKTLTAPTISSPVLSGTITGAYTLAGTPTFPAAVVTLTSSQTLTNKTITSPTITTPTITNASITQDAVTGFTTANSGTVYGIPITLGKMAGTSITNSTVGANQLATGAAQAYVATLETRANAAYGALATASAVTVTIGVNGLALVSLNVGQLYDNNAAGQAFMSFAMSGANTQAAADNYSVSLAMTAANNPKLGASAVFLLTGLAAGSTTFTTQFRSLGADTASFSDRRIAVVPL